MNDDNNNKNDHPNEGLEFVDEKQPEYREISKEELQMILENHKKWVESDGKDGEKANLEKADLVKANLEKAILSDANLQGANVHTANLKHANLERANLQGAHLCNANMQEANLIEANLQGTILEVANMQEAILKLANLQKVNLYKANMKNTSLVNVKGLNEAEDLQYANFEGATGLLGNEFAQADVTGTKLPDSMKDFKALEIVKETSLNARKVFFAMLLGCVYSWLTIATTTDVRLLTNTASSPLPIIGTEIPIAWFYIASPLVLICLYFYFHLYLIKLWEALAGLPAIFPDGKRLDEIAYPWLLNGLVRRHFRLLKTERPIMANVQEWITIFLAWWVVPITMIAFWLRYIPRHDWLGTSFHIVMIVLSVAFAIIFYSMCAFTLQGKEKVTFNYGKFWSDRNFYYGVSVVAIGILFSLLSYGAIKGIKQPARRIYSERLDSDMGYIIIKKNKSNIWKVKPFNFTDLKYSVPLVFEKIGYDVFANFRETIVSEIPSNYGVIAKEERIQSVKGANLNGRSLNSADMYKALMQNADLRNSDLQYAYLIKTNLQNATLRGSTLRNADLRNADLRNADFTHANLQNAIFVSADLQGAILTDTKIQNAYLGGANLQNADLGYANFENANLSNSNLQNTILTSTNFRNADLSDANLQGAKFLSRFTLQNADLRRANLRNIEFYSASKLAEVKTLYQAKLNPDIMEKVKKCCPHLLEKPKEETDTQKVTE